MRARLIIGAIVVVALATAAAFTIFVRNDQSGPAYAYLTPSQLVVMRGSKQLSVVDGTFEYSHLRWTQDGQHVVAVSRMPRLDGTVVAVNALTGSVTSFPCACDDVIPVGNSGAILWTVVHHNNDKGIDFRIARMDLTDTGAGWKDLNIQPAILPYQPAGEPDDRGVGLYYPWLGMQILGAVGNTTFVIAQRQGSSELSATDAVIAFTGDNSQEVLWERPRNPGGLLGVSAAWYAKSFAFAYQGPSECPQHDRLAIFQDLKRLPKIDLSDVDDARVLDGRFKIHDLWWAADGKLRAILSTWTCFNGSAYQAVDEPAVWRLDDAVWVEDGMRDVLSVRDLQDGRRIVLGIDRKLTLSADGGAPRPIASDVSRIAVPRLGTPNG